MTDRRTVMAVAIGLVAVVLTGVVSITVLAFGTHTPPDVLGNVTIGGLGALAALLASTRSASSGDTSTTDTHSTTDTP